MTVSLAHAKIATLPDEAGAEVNKAEWNDAHVPVNGTAGSVLFISAGPVVDQDNANFKWGTTAGQGLTLGAGTATTDVQALSITQTWNNAAIVFGGLKCAITDSASANLSKALQILIGTDNLLSMINKPDCRLTIGHNTAAVRLYLNGALNNAVMAWQVAGVTAASIQLQKPASVSYMSFGDGVSNDHASISPQGFTSLSTGVIGWAASSNAAAANDTGFSRISANVSGCGPTAGSFSGRLKLTSSIAAGVAIAALNAAPTTGEIQSVTDALAPAVGAAVAAGGAAKALVWWNGAQWTVIGI